MQPASEFNSNRSDEHHSIKWDQPSWFIMRALHATLKRKISEIGLPESAQIIDVGCASQPYAHLFPSDAEYTGADLPGNPAARIEINPDGTLPSLPESFDLALSTQVLEHVSEPSLYLSECFRVLKPGGTLLLSTHGLWIYHRDPEDYWRWTADGLKLQIERAGFEVVDVEGIMGLSAVAIQLFQDATLRRMPSTLRSLYAFSLQRLAALFDKMHSPQSRVHNAMVYVEIARKPYS